MKKWKEYRNFIFCGIFVIILFGTFFVNSETTQQEQCWGTLRDTYTYIYDSDVYTYEDGKTLKETDMEITIWDVESEGNDISFRSDMMVVFLGMVRCLDEECYDAYREGWEYDNETESFRVTFRYFNESQRLGFVDPTSFDSQSVGVTMPLPVDPIDLGKHMFGWWAGLGYTFLPVFHSNFSFMSNFSIYELVYQDFEISFEDTFRYKTRKFEGYSYEYSYTFVENPYPGFEFKQEIETKFSYNSQGVLYKYESNVKHYSNTSGAYELTWESHLDYSIDSIDKTLAIANSWIYGLGGILISAIVVFNRRRKNKCKGVSL